MEKPTERANRSKERPYVERLDLLILKCGAMSVWDYLDLRKTTKRKWASLFYGLKKLPERFIVTAELKQTIREDLGVSDHQRFLLMLHQGGYLERQIEPKTARIVYVKTGLFKSLNGRELVADIISKDSVMVGYPKKSRLG